jgi:uncharacterized protein YndB with AHSA1/START domain
MTKQKTMLAKVSQTIDAPVADVWNTLTDPEMIAQYMFGTAVTSDWRVGSLITWEGEWKGERYKDHGVILVVEPGRRLVYTHFSPLSGKPDVAENYHTITFELESAGKLTTLTLSQDNNRTQQGREYAEKNWRIMLEKLRDFLEGKGR